MRAEVPNSKGTPTHLECVHPKASQLETHSCPNGSKLPFGSLVCCVFWSLWLTSGKAVLLMHTGDAREVNALLGGGRRPGSGDRRGLAGRRARTGRGAPSGNPGGHPPVPHRRRGRPPSSQAAVVRPAQPALHSATALSARGRHPGLRWDRDEVIHGIISPYLEKEEEINQNIRSDEEECSHFKGIQFKLLHNRKTTQPLSINHFSAEAQGRLRSLFRTLSTQGNTHGQGLF